MSNRFFLLLGLCVLLPAGGIRAQDADATEDAPPAMADPGDKFPLPDDDIHRGMATTGKLAIQAVQGTPFAEPIGVAKVTVQLFHQGMLLDTIKAETDEHGVVMLEDLPVQSAFVPVVQVAYAGVTYSVVGSQMDIENHQQKLEVPCYEVTEEQPDWKVTMRHLMIMPVAHGLTVTEVMVLQSSGERSWLGEPRPDGKRTTTVFTLPAGATDVNLGAGFHDWCCSTLEDGKLVNHLPLMPGVTQMRFSYHLHADEDSMAIDVVAPAAVDQMVVMLPAELASGVQGLEAGPVQEMGDARVQTYMGRNLQAGAKANLQLTGLSVAPATTAEPGAGQAGVAKVIAIVGGGVLLIVAAFMLLGRPKNRVPTE
ncbi:MAG: hypothetical protein JSV91_04415 [Phycisphaerales bacterium]|nr:MAG: hypothetical protein JSV91_04415 [Phycisphaerales bacterium]